MNNDIKIGSKIVDGGTVYEVFKIEKSKNGDGTQRIIFYRPFFEDLVNGDIVCSIPEINMTPPDMRKPVSKKEVEEVFILLSKRSNKSVEVDIIKAKDVLKLNSIFKTAEVLKNVYKEKMRKGDEFSKSKKDLLNMSFKKIIEEIALVYRVSLSTAEKKINSALESSS